MRVQLPVAALGNSSTVRVKVRAKVKGQVPRARGLGQVAGCHNRRPLLAAVPLAAPRSNKALQVTRLLLPGLCF